MAPNETRTRQTMSCDMCVESKAGGKQGANDESGRLHGKHQRYQHAAMSLYRRIHSMMVAETG